MFTRQQSVPSVVGYLDVDYARDWMTGGPPQVTYSLLAEYLFVGSLGYSL